MRILIGCEVSAVVRDAFRRRGFDAWSCDTQERPGDPYHICADLRTILGDGWRLGIFHPPCTYIAGSGLHWNKRRPGRSKLTEDALDFVCRLWMAPIESIAIENPVGCISTRLGIKPAQTIQPYEFGDDASKRTCLWLRNLPPLQPTGYVEPRMVDGRPRWANQTDSGQNKLPPSEDRAQIRSETYPGIAEAMADQWGRAITSGRLFVA